MTEALRILVGAMLFVGCMSTFWLGPAYLIHRRTGEISGWLVVPLFFVALAVWVVCAGAAQVV